ncbi:MAG: type II toxin-antitoxin system RelE family toxin [Cyanobacteriota bacterium]
MPSQVQQRLQIAINHLKTDLRPIGSIKLKGSDDLYRLRVGDYRIIYQIDDEIKTVVITRVRHRRDVYND